MFPELTEAEKAAEVAYVTTNYRDATIISEPTITYNCHGYAWHIKEGGDARFIGAYNSSDEDIYMTDSSYIQVNPTSLPAKVSYANDDHSAVTDGSSTVFISKWRYGPLVRHAYNYCPYNSGNLKYFVKISDIIGPDAICNNTTTTYTITSVPTASYDWHKSSNLNITINGNSVNVTPTGSGNGWIKVYVSTTGGGYITETKIIKIGNPIISTGSYSNLQDMGYDQHYYKILPSYGVYAYEGTLSVTTIGSTDDTWSFVSNITGKNLAYWSASGNTVDVGAKTGNAGEVLRYTATNTCGSSSATYTFFTGKISEPPPLIITPNPATSQTEISIPDIVTNADEQHTVAIQSQYTINVMNSYGLSVYTASGTEKKIIVPASTLKNGIYIVRVTDGINIYQGNLVILH